MDDVVEKIPTFASNMINFFSSSGLWKQNEELYKNVEAFLQENFNISPLLVFTISVGKNGKVDYFRCLWNEKSVSHYCNKDELKKIMDDIASMDIKKNKWINGQLDIGLYHAFHFGHMNNQMQVGVIFTKKILEDRYRLFKCLIKFIENENIRINAWKDIEKQRSLIYVDDVSELYNQRKLYLDVETIIQLYKKDGGRFCVLFIDIDHFKKVNDNYGHLTGSKLLFQVAKILQETLGHNLIYRYGGDEFVVIVKDVNEIEARKVAKKILDAIREKEFSTNNGEIYKISVSIGVALCPDNISNSMEILEMADKMMFRAKSLGRGRICLVEDM